MKGAVHPSLGIKGTRVVVLQKHQGSAISPGSGKAGSDSPLYDKYFFISVQVIRLTLTDIELIILQTKIASAPKQM